jgi:class 3 adenylate cyclase/tetratricopeptide (TPR) repeat protein
VCSVLFCDVAGFTPLSESRDPEAVRELLTRYFAVARTVIGRYGGVVEKFIGDAVMAVWGAPAATEGDAERAVRAALDLVAAVAEVGTEAGVPDLSARAGVVTGEVAVTLGAVGEGMVAGDAVNTAARVQAAAEPGQILVDGTTYRLAGSAIGFGDAGEHQLKGKTEPVRLWRATRVLAGVGGSQRVDGLEAPLTGRDAELRTIRELFHAAAERRVPRLVLVSGPAGTGKSRLGWEFRKYIEGLAADVWWHRGRCLSYGEGVAFWALAEMVRQRLGIAEEDSADLAAGKLAAGLDQFFPDPGERAYVGVRLGRLLGVGSAEGAAAFSREELFAGWRLFFERLAAEFPVVLLVEDAQHADSGLLDFLDHLVDWAKNLPIYVLVFARPELGQARPRFGAGRNRVTLTLDPLDPESMDQLVDALVSGMPKAARAKVTRQAQGVPLFAVETVRSLVDRDIVQPVEGVYRLVGDIGELTVPDSLHSLLAARLDALDSETRRLVADAAVLGSTFPAEALIAVTGRDEPSVRAALADLVRREVLSVSADPLSPERGSYQFAQDMLRQVAYDTLSRRDRKTRHLAVAAHLRRAFPGDGEEVTDVIARHYLDALHAIPDDPDIAEIRGQAITTLIRAAERADRAGAPARAAASYATAAELSTADDDAGGQLSAGALWVHAADDATAATDYAAAVQHAERAREYYLERGQDRAAARARASAGQALQDWGRYAEAREHLTAAAEILRPNPDTDTVYALQALAALEAFAGSPDAGRLTTEALYLGQALDVDTGQLCDLLNARAAHLYFAGCRAEAIAYVRETARLAAQAGDNFRLGRALLNLSAAMAGVDSAAAAEAARTAAAHLRRAGARDYLATAVLNLTGSLVDLGDWDTAETEFAQAADSDGLADIEHFTCQRGWLAALRGDTATADTVLEGLRELRTTEDPQRQTALDLTEACAAAARGQSEAALRHARAVLAYAPVLGLNNADMAWAWSIAARIAHELGDAAAIRDLLALVDSYQPGHVVSMLQAERDLARARLAAHDGDQAATDAFAAAIASLRERSTPYHLAHGLLDQAQHHLQHGDGQAATQAIDEARAIGRRLRCRPLLDRADAIDHAQHQIRT